MNLQAFLSSLVKDKFSEGQIRWFEKLLLANVSQCLPEILNGGLKDIPWNGVARGGVKVVIVPTTSLNESQLTKLLRYRMAHYLLSEMFDPRLVWQKRLDHEPLDSIGPNDLHVIAVDTRSGEMLCYLTFKEIHSSEGDATFRATQREITYLEIRFGRNLFNSLHHIPDIPFNRIRLGGRFVKNQVLPPRSEQMIRAPIEAIAASFRSIYFGYKGRVLRP